ncbi:tRNA-guanine transglycosylase DpdA [Verrucomicrobia bacterium]|nr:tRNA-guanine transglycosylase DpdA [Verrucomicrobiota bacterium]
MRGIDLVKEREKQIELEFQILSAGYGLISYNRKIAPYETTFQGMKKRELRDWANQLGIANDFSALMNTKRSLNIILLGDSYLEACQITQKTQFASPTLLFCGKGAAKKLPKDKNLKIVTLSNPEAQRFSCGLVALKGELGTRVIQVLSSGAKGIDSLVNVDFDLLSTLEKSGASKPRSARNKQVSTPLPEKSRFRVFIPRKNAAMQYFIPEWDDRVDPDYDFSCDGITEGRDPYTHDVYAHEIYPGPNYDGILVSKSVIEDNQKKKERISQIGIHRHVRVPRNFPVMGDCGAFNYIDEEEPPYETDETVSFFQSLDFDYGVSIDHLIVPQHLKRTVYCFVDVEGNEHEITKEEFEEKKRRGNPVAKARRRSRDLFANDPYLTTFEVDDLREAKRRWKLTLENAAEFVESHRKSNATFTPIAGCQGWDVESQTEMFKQQQEMGYSYIALGGLVRSKTAQILEILESVNRIRKQSTKIHLFGVARPEAINAFREAGVNSIDSARFLRQAWLSATSNYYTGDGEAYMEASKGGRIAKGEDKWRYAAVRIPPVHREGSQSLTAKAKKTVEKGYTAEELQRKEKTALEKIHAYDRGEIGLEETLTTITEYDQLMGGDTRNEAHYRRVLSEKPWQKCPCQVCQKTGIDTIIFRRNNRNRRRGFHNTWWFYRLFSKLTCSTDTESLS